VLGSLEHSRVPSKLRHSLAGLYRAAKLYVGDHQCYGEQRRAVEGLLSKAGIAGMVVEARLICEMAFGRGDGMPARMHARLGSGTPLAMLLAAAWKRVCALGQRCAVWGSAVLCGAALCCVGQRCAVWGSAVLCGAALCCVGQRCAEDAVWFWLGDDAELQASTSGQLQEDCVLPCAAHTAVLRCSAPGPVQESRQAGAVAARARPAWRCTWSCCAAARCCRAGCCTGCA
jgi:hypothetical protein